MGKVNKSSAQILEDVTELLNNWMITCVCECVCVKPKPCRANLSNMKGQTPVKISDRNKYKQY